MTLKSQTPDLTITPILQKLATIHGLIYNHFNHERHLETRQAYKQKRAAALIEWREIYAA
jgi:hypothetical protein